MNLLRKELGERTCGEGLVGEDEVEGRCADEGVTMTLKMQATRVVQLWLNIGAGWGGGGVEGRA